MEFWIFYLTLKYITGHLRKGKLYVHVCTGVACWASCTCYLVLLVGLVAYLSIVLDGWSPCLRGIFIEIFGAATGLTCIGAMALVSETLDLSAWHFAHIVLRLTFIVGSLSIQVVVFYLLEEVRFIVWLLVAAGTILGMTYIWRVGSPERFATFVSWFCSILGSVYNRVMGLFYRA